MSQIEVAIDDSHKLIVGYDSPLRTFFCFVHSLVNEKLQNEAEAKFNDLVNQGKDSEADAVFDNVPKPIVFACGQQYDQFQTVEQLEEELVSAGWGVLDEAVKEQLRQDKAQESAVFQPSFIQTWVEQANQEIKAQRQS